MPNKRTEARRKKVEATKARIKRNRKKTKHEASRDKSRGIRNAFNRNERGVEFTETVRRRRDKRRRSNLLKKGISEAGR
jgi:hypothetical protein